MDAVARLTALLEAPASSAAVRARAAGRLVELAADGEAPADALAARLRPLLLAPDWDVRAAAATAVGGLVDVGLAPDWSIPAAHVPLSLDGFSLDRVRARAAPLLADSPSAPRFRFSSAASSSSPSSLEAQRREFVGALGLDLPPQCTSGMGALVERADLEAAPEDPHEQERGEAIRALLRDPGQAPTLVGDLSYLILDARWWCRHGAAAALAALLARSPGKQPAWMEDVAVRCLCLLALDRFADYGSGDGVSAPTCEAAGAALAAAWPALPEPARARVVEALERLLADDAAWEARHAAAVGLRHLRAGAPAALAAALAGDASSDVRRAAAAALEQRPADALADAAVRAAVRASLPDALGLAARLRPPDPALRPLLTPLLHLPGAWAALAPIARADADALDAAFRSVAARGSCDGWDLLLRQPARELAGPAAALVPRWVAALTPADDNRAKRPRPDYDVAHLPAAAAAVAQLCAATDLAHLAWEALDPGGLGGAVLARHLPVDPDCPLPEPQPDDEPRTAAERAGAVVRHRGKPAKATPVVRALMLSIRTERDAELQRRSADALAELAALPDVSERTRAKSYHNVCRLLLEDDAPVARRGAVAALRAFARAGLPPDLLLPPAVERPALLIALAPALSPAALAAVPLEDLLDTVDAAALVVRHSPPDARTAAALGLVQRLEAGDDRAGHVLAALGRSLGVDALPFIGRLLPAALAATGSPSARLGGAAALAAVVELAPLLPTGALAAQLAPAAQDQPDERLFAVQMRPYQRAGVRWLRFLARVGLHGALCDDMGLGKTLQALAAVLHAAADGPSLVVCPATLVAHWQAEAERLFAQPLPCDVLAYAGAPDRRRVLLPAAAARGAVLVASYGVARADAAALAGVQWNYVVLDEGHAIRNAQSATSEAVCALRARRRLLLSGTPVQNNVRELWALWQFVLPGYLGARAAFEREFARPVAALEAAGTDAAAVAAGEAALQRLHRRVLPLVLRRRKADVLRDLPPKVLQDVPCELSAAQQLLYRAFQQQAGGDDFQQLQLLRQVCVHPRLALGGEEPGPALAGALGALGAAGRLDDYRCSGKLVALRQLLLELGDRHRCLVFAQHKAALDCVERDLLAAELPGVTHMRLDGDTPAAARAALAAQFNGGDAQLMLLTTAVGGLGLSLVGADVVIMLEHDWNPARDLQAMDRAHRLTQTRRVHVYRLVTRGTLEERIMSLQQFKQRVSSAVVADSAPAADIGVEPEELLALFGSSAA